MVTVYFTVAIAVTVAASIVPIEGSPNSVCGAFTTVSPFLDVASRPSPSA
jgi:hypothetical protein